MNDLITQSTSPKSAVKFIRRMHGSSQAALVECDDGNNYIVKMVGCPQGANVLANEWLGSILAASVDLPVARTQFIHLSSSFVATNPRLVFEMPTSRLSVEPGLHVGSLFAGEVTGPQRTIQYFPRAEMANVANRACFIGMCLFDVWAGYRGRRKVLFRRNALSCSLEAVFINQSKVFGGPQWMLSDFGSPGRQEHSLYSGMWSDRAVSSWIGIFRRQIPDVLRSAFAMVPNHWYNGDLSAVEASLRTRLDDLPEAIRVTRDSGRS